MNKIPLSKIGPVQLIDVEHSGQEVHDECFRTCTVLQGSPPTSAIGDDVPYRIAELYNGSWEDWNKHVIAQVSGCPLSCWYCYVDNLRTYRGFTVAELVQGYAHFREHDPCINVFHLMGGCPGRFSPLWPWLRDALDLAGFRETILLTDVILLEDHFYGVSPWMHIPDRTVVSVCLKGTNFQNFMKNTGIDGFAEAIKEMWEYFNCQHSKQTYFSLIGWDPEDKLSVEKLIGANRINWLTVKEYEVVKRRMDK